ncbi:Gp49 family protein [Rummeliibacillus sp. JY-2-4R]
MENNATKIRTEEILSKSQFEIVKMMDKTVVVCCKLPNGLEIVESLSCVDQENYDELLGSQICINRIANRLHELEGCMTRLN